MVNRLARAAGKISIASSSEVCGGSRKEIASKQKIRASVLIRSEPEALTAKEFSGA
jgi:hypothetical protein